MQEMPLFAGGHTELTAAMLNTVADYIRRQSRLVPTPGVHVTQTPDGWQARMDEAGGVWGRITGGNPESGYYWEAMDLEGGGGFTSRPTGDLNATDTNNAFEANGKVVPRGTVVWMEPNTGPTGTLAYYFAAPAYDPEKRPAVFWAALTDEADGTYGYVEQIYDGTEFRDNLENGRTADAGTQGAAVEAGGTSGIEAGTIVLMMEPAVNEDDTAGDECRGVGFRVGSGSGIWGQISGRTVNPVYLIDLDGATGGSFYLTFTDVELNTTYTTAWIAPECDAAAVQKILDTALGVGQATVTATAEAGATVSATFTITMFNNWGGSRAQQVALVADNLTWPESEDEEEEHEATLTQTVTGRDDPYTDGQGNYGWFEVTWTSSRVVIPKVGGIRSNWPYGAASEGSGETRVPVGTVVRIHSGASVSLTNSSGTVTDQRYSFEYHGPPTRWAMVGRTATWKLNLDNPTAGLFMIRWDDPTESPLPRQNAAYTLTGAAVSTVGAFRLTWTQGIPRLVSNGSGGYNLVTTSVQGPVISNTATASEIQAALIATYPIFDGNISVTGGPLSPPTTVTPPADACGNVGASTITPKTVRIEFINDLGYSPILPFTITNVTGPGASVSPTATNGSGVGMGLLAFNVPAAQNGSTSTTLGNVLGGNTTLFFAEVRPVDVYTRAASGNVNSGPVQITAMGLDTETPELTLVDFLDYGVDGNDIGEATLTEEPTELPADADSSYYGAARYPVCMIDSTTVARTLVSAYRCENRIVVASAFEANGSRNVEPRAIVRLYPGAMPGERDPDTGGAVAEHWCFTAPSHSFLGMIGGGGKTSARYSVFTTPLNSFLTVSARVTRAGKPVWATEECGYTCVPANAIVRVLPFRDDDGELQYRFRYTPTEETRLLYYRGAGWSAAEPSANAVLDGITSLNGTNGGPAILTNTDSFTLGACCVGVLTGWQMGATDYLPMYRGGGATIHPVAIGQHGTLTPRNQVLGSGSKTIPMWQYSQAQYALAVSFTNILDNAHPPALGGDAMPTTSRLTYECDETGYFFGVRGDGGKFGFICTPPPYNEETWKTGFVAAPYTTTFLARLPIAPSDTQLSVTLSNPQTIVDDDADFYMQIIVVPGQIEVVHVTKVCASGGTGTLTVERGLIGTTPVTATQMQIDQFKVTMDSTVGVYIPGGDYVGLDMCPRNHDRWPIISGSVVVRNGNVNFYTDQPAFGVDGNAGGGGIVTLTGVTDNFNVDLEFAGGLLVGGTWGSCGQALPGGSGGQASPSATMAHSTFHFTNTTGSLFGSGPYYQYFGVRDSASSVTVRAGLIASVT